MPLYFFHIRDGKDLPDEVGTVLPDDEAARSEAVRASIGLIYELGEVFWRSGEWSMNVVDEIGRHVVRLTFRGEMAPPATVDECREVGIFH